MNSSKLKAMRLKVNLSQSEVAKAANIHIRTLQGFEQGIRNIDSTKLSILCKLSEVLSCSIPDILEDQQLIDSFNRSK